MQFLSVHQRVHDLTNVPNSTSLVNVQRCTPLMSYNAYNVQFLSVHQRVHDLTNVPNSMSLVNVQRCIL